MLLTYEHGQIRFEGPCGLNVSIRLDRVLEPLWEPFLMWDNTEEAVLFLVSCIKSLGRSPAFIINPAT